MTPIAPLKVVQAAALLAELDIDCWLTFVRETGDGGGDPVLPLILDRGLTWQSALILTRSGDRIAIVGSHDADSVRSVGAWANVLGYVQSIRGPLVTTLKRLDPRRIAINFSPDNVKADGLTHGMLLLLKEYLAGTPYVDRFESAEPIIRRLRGRKTAEEVGRVRAAVATAQQIFAEVAGFARPGVSEVEISRFMQDQAAARGVGLAWDARHCPIVNTGPQSMGGHGLPSASLKVEPGRIFHLDFGVMQEGYCSDLQRAWHVPSGGETAPPREVMRAFDAVRASILAAAEALRPGVECWRVDEAARSTLVKAGFEEYDHATGHEVGRAAHDGGGVLGPRWERYGQTPTYRVEAGNVFTLELGVNNVDGRGYLGLEEMVLVTDRGLEWLSTPQTTLPLLGA